MSSRKWFLYIGLLAPILLLSAACSENETKGTTDWRGVCIDLDGDSYGFQCAPGADCDDNNSQVHKGCGRCDKPADNCECVSGQAPVSCSLPYELTSSGGLLCREGMRYCRDDVWTSCEGISSFVAPPPTGDKQLGGTRQALVGDAGDSGASCGNPCNPDCYRVEDRLDSFDGGLPDALITSTQVVKTSGGGITVYSTGGEEEAVKDAGNVNAYDCSVGLPPDKDCDRIPDQYDDLNELAGEKPFETTNNSIFADLAPGQSVSQTFDLKFKVNTADIYFYMDMSGSMAEERDQLIDDLTVGNFLPADVAGNDCSDRNFDGTADNELKTAGVTGNIACLIREANFGAGWFRDIPFSGYGAVDYEMFEHRIDITGDTTAVKSSLEGFLTRSGVDTPEGSMQGMWSLITGKELHAGWSRPGIPARSGCPAGTWGYPCFRDGTIPIIIHITDDWIHEGPAAVTGMTSDTVPYNATTLAADPMSVGTPDPVTGLYYRPLTSAADTLANAQDFGTVDGKLITYVGDTSKMVSDYTYASAGVCGAGTGWSTTSQTAPDAVFKFTVGTNGPSGPRTLRLSSAGTRFNSSIMLMSDSLPAGQAVSGNGSYASPANLGTFNGTRQVWTGDNSNTTTHPPVYSREALSLDSNTTCFANGNSADLGPVAVHKLQLATDNMSLRLTGTGGTGQNVAIFAGVPKAPTTISLTTGINCGAGVVSNCNDTIGKYSAGDLVGKHLHYIAGDTALASVTSNYNTYFATCPSSYTTSGDTALDFTLSQATNIRIETAGTGTTLTSSFNHGISLMKFETGPFYTTTNVPSGNGNEANAYSIADTQITATNGDWMRFEGNSSTDGATFAQSQVGGSAANVCNNGNTGAASAERDMVFKFTVNSTATYEFETLPTDPTSGYKTWLSLHKDMVTKPTTTIALQSSNDGTHSIGSVEKSTVVLNNGQMNLADRTHRQSWMNGCGSTSGSAPLGGRDYVFSFTVDSATSVAISTVAASGASGTLPGFNSFVHLFEDGVSDGNQVLGSCADQATNAFSRTFNVVPGTTYYAVVKEWTYDGSMSNAEGSFGVIVSDTRTPQFLACDAGSLSSSTNYSRISRSLTAGTYFVVVKGTGTGSNHQYALNIRKPATLPVATRWTSQACAESTSGRAHIDGTYPAGSYSVIVKGRGTAEGKFNLTLRDLGVAPQPLACYNTFSKPTITTAPLPRLNASTGLPIDYYVVSRNNTTAGSPYTLVVESGTAAGYVNACDDDSAVGDDGELYLSVYPGTYYAILKGASAGLSGMFQMTIGDATPSSATYAPKSYTSEIKAALNAKNVRVISLNATGAGLTGGGTTSLSKGYKQTIKLAQETGAPTVSSLKTYEVNGLGAGMGSQIISAVSDLTKSLRMDLFTQLVPIAPNIPSPLFGFSSTAVNVPTGNCTGGISADNTTHLTCGPGAQPTFRVTVTNPLSNPVPVSTLDSNGGYMMQLQLVGKVTETNGTVGTYIVDKIPVYIIPEDVIDDAPAATYAGSGTYEEAMASGCSGTARPNWRSLYWDASLPANTSIAWKMCTADTDAELTSCSLVTAATVTSGAACTSSAQCTNGYCAASGVCEYVVGPNCTANTDCGTGGVCVNNSGVSTCRWTQNPIDLLPALRNGLQGKSKMRLSVTMNANPTRTAAPTINDWDIEYRCSPGL
jgi:hypothetical protein